MAETINPRFVPTPASGLNAPGSQYADIFSKESSALRRAAIQRQIFDLAPKQWDPIKLLNLMGTVEQQADEFMYAEKVWQRNPYEVATWTHGTGVLELAGTYTYADDMRLRVNDKIYNSTGVQFIVKAVTHSASVDTASITLAIVDTSGSDAVASGNFTAGDIFVKAGNISADGMDEIGTGNKIETVQRYNYFEFFEEAQKWTPLELQTMMNTGTTNVMDLQKEEHMNALRLNIFSAMYGGTRGEATVYKPSSTGTTYKGKTMHGIFQNMVDGGSEHSSPTWSGLQSAFEHHAFSTNKKAAGGTRFIVARNEILTELAKLYKDNKTRYAPNDMAAKLDLSMYEFGTMKFVPVGAELFASDAGVLPPIWENRALVLDLANFKRCTMKGIPYIDGGQTGNRSDGFEKDYTKWWARGFTSLQANGVNGSFYMDIQ